MPIETILTVKKKHLSELGPESAVDIYRGLVWAEASSSGIPKSSTNIPSDIYDPDGGIDAKVTNSPVDSRQGIIKKGLTCYQVKTGGSVPSTEAQVKKILFKKGSNDLKPEVREESRHELPEDLGLKLLTHPTLFTKSKEERESMRDFNWSELGKWYVKKYPARSLELAKVMLEHFGEDGTIIDDHYGSPIEVLDKIVERYPEQVWEEIAKHLGPPIDSRAFHIKHWLRGDEFSRKKGGVLQLIPLRKLWEWVDEDIPKRARYLASMVPKILFREEGRICLAREVLARYGDRDDVKNEMMANFSTESWTGPVSSHLHGKKEYLLKFKVGETNRNVRRWIDGFIAILDREIERARVREERQEF